MRVSKSLYCSILLVFSSVATTQSQTISHWSMNGSGFAEVDDIVLDVVGDNDGFVLNEALEYVPGNADSPSALLFEQSTQDKIEVLDDVSLHFDLAEDSFTMETVFRVADNATGRPAPFGKNGSAAADSQYWARVRADQTGGIQFLVRGDGGDGPGGILPPERIVTTKGSVTDGLWHHFAAVYEAAASSFKLFLDYNLDSTLTVDPADGIIGDNVGSLILGGFTSSSREFGGAIADVRFSNAALGPDQFLPELSEGNRQALVAGDTIGIVTLERTLSDIVVGEPIQSEGLAQYWYNGNMRGKAEAFLNAGDTGSEVNPLITPTPFASKTTWWAGSQDNNVLSDVTLPRYPDGLQGTRFDGNPNADDYGVRLTGEIFISENGEYLLRDGIDDFAMISIDQDGNGELDGLEDITDADVGNGAFGDVLIVDDAWANIAAGNQRTESHGLAEIENIPAGGDWRRIEIWMSEGGGGDGAVLYMGNLNDEAIFDDTIGDSLSQEERDAFAVPNDRLRSSVPTVESGIASGELQTNVEYVMQVSKTGNDQFSINDNDGLYQTTLNVAGATVRVQLEEEIEDGTAVTLFDVDSVAGLETLTLLLEDESQWNLDNLSRGEIVFGQSGATCDPNSGGDLDGNGSVDFLDFLTLANNFGDEVADHTFGDIDCSGSVGFLDFLALANNFGASVERASSVPEPSSTSCLMSFAFAAIGCVRRKRCRRLD